MLASLILSLIIKYCVSGILIVVITVFEMNKVDEEHSAQ
jgi:hypothetical protein